jgi:two-component system chemotaxis sensor kinase CheA
MDFDEEILQDFLVEASEIHEQLGQQLVDFENDQSDEGLVNAIFRAFHTIKGGAAFLQLTNLVSLCHRAEDVFDLVRAGTVEATEDVTSLYLDIYDVLSTMFEELHAGEELSEPPAAMIKELETIMKRRHGAVEADEAPAGSDAAEGSDLDAEFEAMMEANNGDPAAALEDEFEAMMEANSAGGSDSSSIVLDEAISDGEFEDILDSMYGSGKFDEDATPITDLTNTVSGDSDPAPKKEVAPAPKPKPKKDAKPKKKKEAASDQSVRVDVSVLDHIMNMVGELVLVRNRLVTLETGKDSGEITNEEYSEEIEKSITNLDVVTSDLQLAVMKTRMQPIKRVFGRFPRVVRDLAKRLNKKLQVVMEGENTDLDKNLVEELSDPLIHLIRNSADHGVETPERRIAVGKDPKGTIKLGASQQGDSIILIIADDGAGIDKERVKQIALERGVITPDEANRMSDTEAFNLIFAPGFSTTTETTDVSGRGVGMDVVKTKITQLNGSITIDSEKDVGTTITIKVPLTLAIMPTLTVRVASQIFALPLANVKEILSLDGRPTNNVENRRMLPLRDRTIPIYYLKHWLIEGANTFDNPDTGHVVVVQVGEIQIGFIVDGLIGQEEVVIKPLGDAFRDTPGLAGATITGNGKVSIILDLQDLIQANT